MYQKYKSNNFKPDLRIRTYIINIRWSTWSKCLKASAFQSQGCRFKSRAKYTFICTTSLWKVSTDFVYFCTLCIRTIYLAFIFEVQICLKQDLLTIKIFLLFSEVIFTIFILIIRLSLTIRIFSLIKLFENYYLYFVFRCCF